MDNGVIWNITIPMTRGDKLIRVMIVEDDPMVREINSKFLKE